MKIEVSLTKENIQEAIADWLNKHKDTNHVKWFPSHIGVNVSVESEGHGVNEKISHVVRIVASKEVKLNG